MFRHLGIIFRQRTKRSTMENYTYHTEQGAGSAQLSDQIRSDNDNWHSSYYIYYYLISDLRKTARGVAKSDMYVVDIYI